MAEQAKPQLRIKCYKLHPSDLTVESGALCTWTGQKGWFIKWGEKKKKLLLYSNAPLKLPKRRVTERN